MLTSFGRLMGERRTLRGREALNCQIGPPLPSNRSERPLWGRFAFQRSGSHAWLISRVGWMDAVEAVPVNRRWRSDPLPWLTHSPNGNSRHASQRGQ